MSSIRKRDYVAKDLRTAKYKMRVVPCSKQYNRKKEKNKFLKELIYV